MEEKKNRKHLIVLAIFLLFLFSILIAQFYRIQIIENDKWTTEAKKQHFFIVKEPFLRGKFISNTSIKKGHPEIPQSFVVDVEKFHLYVDPQSIPKKNRSPISQELGQILNLSINEKITLKEQFYKKSRSRKLALWLDQETRNAILEWWYPYCKKNKIPRNALYFINDYRRSYPFGKLLGQVLHTIQETKDEKTNQAIPTGGLELYFNSYLKGKQGKRRLMRSPRNSFETGEVISIPENGADIYLTINHCLQAIAEEGLEKGVKKCKGKAGWAVMIEPRSGEILALAQYPFFNPSEYQYYFNNPLLTEQTRVKAITDANEPGSVMKPFTLAAALLANEQLKEKGEAPIFDPLAKISTSDGRFKGRSKPLNDTRFHAFLNMEMALQKSSNRYMARLVESIIKRLGVDWYRNVLQECYGFGKKTGIELPAESSGVLPMPGKKHPNGSLEWSGATPYSLAMGHNVQITGLQIARAYCIFANGGYLIQPTLIQKIVRKNVHNENELLLEHTENWQKGAPKVMTNEIVDTVVRAMKYVTKTGGTSVKANVLGYTEAGKTGTANKVVNGGYSQTQYCSTFVGFTPVKNSAFVLLVTMDEPEYGYVPGLGRVHMGGNCTAEVFREIATKSLQYLGIPSDDLYGYAIGDPRYDSSKADWVKEAKQLGELYEKWNKK